MEQNWELIEDKLTNNRGESYIDVKVARCFFNAGWIVHPEAGYRFQLKRDYEDGEKIDGITSKEAKDLFIEFLKVGGA